MKKPRDAIKPVVKTTAGGVSMGKVAAAMKKVLQKKETAKKYQIIINNSSYNGFSAVINGVETPYPTHYIQMSGTAMPFVCTGYTVTCGIYDEAKDIPEEILDDFFNQLRENFAKRGIRHVLYYCADKPSSIKHKIFNKYWEKIHSYVSDSGHDYQRVYLFGLNVHGTSCDEKSEKRGY